MNKLYIFGIMKKYISLFIVAAFVVTANAQQFPNPDLTYGKEFRRVMADSTLYLPTGCGAPSGTASLKSTVINKAAKYYDSCAGLEYTFNPKLQSWSVSGLGGHAGNADSLNHQAPAYYLAWPNFTGIPTFYYQTVNGNGTSVTQRPAINFGSQFTVADNSGSSRTDITISAIDASITTTGIFAIGRLDTTHTSTGVATYQYFKWKIDSLGTVSSAVYKFASDSFFTTGFATRGRVKQLTDSMSATVTKYTDTSSLLGNYARYGWVVKYTDTSSMLSNRLKISDTTYAFSNYLRKTTLILPAEGGTGYTSLSSLAGDAAFTGAFQAKATNLTSLSALSYASTSFVKMTAAGTFALDVNTYLTTSSASSTYLNLSGSNANQNIGIGSYSFTAGAIYSSVSSGNNINIDKSGGGAINFTRSSVQHFLLEDDTNGIGFYYGSSPVLGATIGANATFASSVTASSFIGGSFSGTTGNFSSTVTGSGFNGASLTGTGLFLSSSQLQMLGGAASLNLDMVGGVNRISSSDSYDYFFNMYITGDSHNTGFEIQRNKVSGSYNTDWTIRLTTNNTDLQFANGGTSVMALATTGKLTLTNIEVLKGYTVSGLPAGVTGAWAYVTDASGPTYGATVVGGGSVVTPVFYNGSNWTCR